MVFISGGNINPLQIHRPRHITHTPPCSTSRHHIHLNSVYKQGKGRATSTSQRMKSFKLSLLFVIGTLDSVSAAPRKRTSERYIPSFIPASPHKSKSRRHPSTDPSLLLRGGQQFTSTSQHAQLDVFATTSPFVQYNVVLAGINLLGMGISLTFPRMQYHLDLLGTGAFALASLTTVLGSTDLPLRVQLSTAAVSVWSIKLAAFLFFRACKVKSDARLEGLLSSVPGTSE